MLEWVQRVFVIEGHLRVNEKVQLKFIDARSSMPLLISGYEGGAGL